MRLIVLCLALCSLPLPLSALEAFPPTPADTSELKTLPAGLLLKSASGGDYFDHGNQLFGPLFRYISKHEIAMTTPVEARVDDAAMFFWVAPSEQGKLGGNEAGVEVIPIPERRVASRGGRGGYSRENFEATRTALLAWLSRQPEVEAAGAAYAVYWNSPFMPFFLKRYEVHIPVRTRAMTK